ncbi:MAG TPA: hypothetical protein VKU00_17025 [Chthonomonadaceae bacterium]|nr:hypothetical protein [Chthonomonadaceae bacterium]
MSGLGIDTTQLTQSIFQLGATQAISPALATNQAQGGAQGVDTDGDQGGAASVKISKQAQLLSQLQQLQQQDPTQFKQVVTNIADQLTQAAQSSTGQDQQFLTALAGRFQQAETGDLSGFTQQQPAATSSVQAAYTQGAQATDPLQTAIAATQNGQTTDPTQTAAATTQGAAQGHHHHHHHGGGGGGQNGLSAQTQQTLSGIFQDLNSALSSSTSTSSSAVTQPTQAAL